MFTNLYILCNIRRFSIIKGGANPRSHWVLAIAKCWRQSYRNVSAACPLPTALFHQCRNGVALLPSGVPTSTIIGAPSAIGTSALRQLPEAEAAVSVPAPIDPSSGVS